jgi:hypothetical protein
MNDNDLIDELREGMREHTDHTEVPSGFADQARRTARRRSARRAVAAGTPLLAAAGVATVLATSAGSHSSSPRDGQTANVAVGGGQMRDTAYVIQRVRAHLAAASQSDVVETVETGGNGNPGTDVTVPSWWYTDPQSGVEYSSSAMISPSGTHIYEQFVVGTPINNGIRYQYTNLDPVQHLYAVSSNVGPNDPATDTDAAADAQQIKQELDSGKATEDGTATVDGQPTIKLEFPEAQGWTSTLYVDSQTYEPVQSLSVAPATVQDPSAGTDTVTENWLPPTAANIASAQLAQIPAGYTQVSQTTLEKENPAGR